MLKALNLQEGLQELINQIEKLKTEKSVITVGIGGGSGSGKTTQVADKLTEYFEDSVLLISLDDYYKNDEFIRNGNYDEPEALDLELFAKHLRQLKNRQTISKPVYKIKKIGGERVGFEKIKPKKIILFEGLFALHQIITPETDLKVFVETNTHGRLFRRLFRDSFTKRAGRSLTTTFEHFFQTTLPMHKLHVQPTKENATLIINNEYDPEKEALNIIKTKLHPRLNNENPVFEFNSQNKTELKKSESLKILKEKSDFIVIYEILSGQENTLLNFGVDEKIINLFKQEYQTDNA